MIPIKKILCPTDFSEPSLLALDAAIELAKVSGAEIILVHVVSPLAVYPFPEAVPASGNLLSLQETLAQGNDSVRHLVRQKIPEGVNARGLVVAGNPADEITRSAEAERADLVVIATHGHTGWRRFMFGSVTEKVVRLSACPVLTIPAPKEP